MVAPLVIRAENFEGQDMRARARVIGADGLALTTNSVASWDLTVRDMSKEGSGSVLFTLTGQPSFLALNDVLDPGGGWTKDNLGSNMDHTVSDGSIGGARGGRNYHYTYEFSLAIGGIIVVMFDITTRSASG